jgi:hypothetical protein
MRSSCSRLGARLWARRPPARPVDCPAATTVEPASGDAEEFGAATEPAGARLHAPKGRTGTAARPLNGYLKSEVIPLHPTRVEFAPPTRGPTEQHWHTDPKRRAQSRPCYADSAIGTDKLDLRPRVVTTTAHFQDSAPETLPDRIAGFVSIRPPAFPLFGVGHPRAQGAPPGVAAL